MKQFLTGVFLLLVLGSKVSYAWFVDLGKWGGTAQGGLFFSRPFPRLKDSSEDVFSKTKNLEKILPEMFFTQHRERPVIVGMMRSGHLPSLGNIQGIIAPQSSNGLLPHAGASDRRSRGGSPSFQAFHESSGESFFGEIDVNRRFDPTFFENPAAAEGSVSSSVPTTPQVPPNLEPLPAQEIERSAVLRRTQRIRDAGSASAPVMTYLDPLPGEREGGSGSVSPYHEFESEEPPQRRQGRGFVQGLAARIDSFRRVENEELIENVRREESSVGLGRAIRAARDLRSARRTSVAMTVVAPSSTAFPAFMSISEEMEGGNHIVSRSSPLRTSAGGELMRSNERESVHGLMFGDGSNSLHRTDGEYINREQFLLTPFPQRSNLESHVCDDAFQQKKAAPSSRAKKKNIETQQ